MKHIVILFAAIALLAGCKTGPNGAEEEEAATQASEPAAAAPTREVRRRERQPSQSDEPAQTDRSTVDPSRELPEFTGQLESEGYGLDMVIDGSSPEAFQQSLELIAMESSEEQYQRVQSAIGYLNYANPAFRDLETMYTDLDGKTGHEIIEMARKLQSRRRGQ